MTVLVWDKVGERLYETGVDRGVLYLTDGGAAPWNGLISVTENRASDLTSYYVDGIKYLDYQILGAYAAKLSAFTYPEELEPLIGTLEFSPGVFLYDQRPGPFHLSYRTRIGNDLDGVDHGYRIHLVYNVVAVQSDFPFTTLAESVTVNPFEWDLKGVPNPLSGAHPTSHIALDSRRLDPAKLSSLEDILYGTPGVNPHLPELVDLLELVLGP